MKTTNDLREILSVWMLKTNPNVKIDVCDKCVEMKKLTKNEATSLENGTLNLHNIEVQKLFWILKNSSSIASEAKKLGKLEDYFTDIEIRNYEFFEVDDDICIENVIVFENVENLTPKEMKSKQYGFYLTVEQIKRYYSAGIFQVIPELQRGGRKNSYDELKIKVNRKRVKEIASKISNGEYFYNSISLNLIDEDDTDWEYNGNRLTVNKGTIIVPDGNHRAFACENVTENNTHLGDKFHILFTVLNPSETRKKIEQEWNTEPVSKSQKEYMENNNSNKILEMVLRSDEIDELIKDKIITSTDKNSHSEGAYIFSDISKAIQKYYSGNKIITKEEQRELADWLIKVFNRIAYLFKDDIINFVKIRKDKWNVSSYAMYGFVYLSKEIQGKDNWKDILDGCLNKIDFNNTEIIRSSKSEKAKINKIEKIFSEVIGNVNV